MALDALWKPLALVTVVACYRISITPPSPPPTSKDKLYVGNLFERMLKAAVFVNKTYTSAILLAEAAVHLAVAFPHLAPPAVLDFLCPLGHPAFDVLATLSTPFIIGLLLAVLGTALRVWCYRSLGRHFTFEVTLLHDHQLVTDGPYAYVRHPSYTGGLFLFVGLPLMVLAPNGWVSECGILSTPLGVAIQLWLGFIVWVAYSLCSRISIEDGNLRSRFGKDWESYAKDVPWKLIPGVY